MARKINKRSANKMERYKDKGGRGKRVQVRKDGKNTGGYTTIRRGFADYMEPGAGT